MCLLVIFYWKMSDNTAFYEETQNLVRLIKSDAGNIKYLFQSAQTYNDDIKLDIALTATASGGSDSNFFLAKVCTILYPFAFGSYIVLNLFFSIIAATGQFFFYLALSRRYPHIRKNVAVAVLFIPSVLLYSSYLNKETLCMACIGFAFYSHAQFMNGKHRLLHALIILSCCYVIATVKIYVLASFLAAVALVYFIKAVLQLVRGSVLLKLLAAVLLTALAIVFFTHLEVFDPLIADAAKTSNTFQEQYHSIDENTAFEFGEVETSFAGLVKKAPLGIYTTYFRPQLWEVRKPIILVSAIESFIVLLIALSALVTRRKNFFPLLKHDMFACISFYFALIFGMIVGLSTFNFGSLIRYKIPGVPFLMMFIFLLLHYHAKKPAAVNPDK